MFSDDGNRRVNTAKSARDSYLHWPGTPAAQWDQFQFLSFLLSTHFLEPSNFLTLYILFGDVCPKPVSVPGLFFLAGAYLRIEKSRLIFCRPLDKHKCLQQLSTQGLPVSESLS